MSSLVAITASHGASVALVERPGVPAVRAHRIGVVVVHGVHFTPREVAA